MNPFSSWTFIFNSVFGMMISNAFGLFGFMSVVLIIVVTFIIRITSRKK